MNLKMISHGAEAKIYEDVDNSVIYKYRISKGYRIKILDEFIIKKRTKSELKIIQSLRKAGVNVPKALSFHEKVGKQFNDEVFKNKDNLLLLSNKYVLELQNSENQNSFVAKKNIPEKFNQKNTFLMEKVSGITLKQYILNHIDDEVKLEEIFTLAGRLIKKIHKNGIVHGDITSNNFIVKCDDSIIEIFAIDFGLAFTTLKSEDKAVDLYVFIKALKCDYEYEKFAKFIEWFYSAYNDKQVLNRLEKVCIRGRKREEKCIG
ncbi:BUD32 protein kinase [Edhazardia aedis USNM 41457]|uniref:non-specific serine/threonine protein kinase n=1 Tax=Edhazardia aedis (strain USNM 41457) TaxID=1003232 RepID=J8ZPM1_EDHAE|nr:BUD32 protein kinase [Edhazardia aedis USNM 41457]|eukprot:EJW01628.1 BUD32 protein kinase [Edhazardia aedis USNM 41457]